MPAQPGSLERVLLGLVSSLPATDILFSLWLRSAWLADLSWECSKQIRVVPASGFRLLSCGEALNFRNGPFPLWERSA